MKVWDDIFIDYLQYERGCSANTVNGYRTVLKEFRQYVGGLPVEGEFSWDEVDGDTVRNWMMKMMDEGKAATTVNFKLSALRSFYRFLLLRKMLEKDPVHNIQGPKKAKLLPSYMKDEEMDKLFDSEGFFSDDFAGERDRLMLLMFYSTGIRAAELISLDLASVDLDSMQLKVLGKRNKQRIVPYGDELGDALRSYLSLRKEFQKERHPDETALFLDEKSGNRITYAKVRTKVRYYLSLVTSRSKRSPHVLRHTFATTMLNHHADLQSVKELLGHEKLSTTEIYTHTSFEDLKEMYNQAHPRAK